MDIYELFISGYIQVLLFQDNSLAYENGALSAMKTVT